MHSTIHLLQFIDPFRLAIIVKLKFQNKSVCLMLESGDLSISVNWRRKLIKSIFVASIQIQQFFFFKFKMLILHVVDACHYINISWIFLAFTINKMGQVFGFVQQIFWTVKHYQCSLAAYASLCVSVHWINRPCTSEYVNQGIMILIAQVLYYCLYLKKTFQNESDRRP